MRQMSEIDKKKHSEQRPLSSSTSRGRCYYSEKSFIVLPFDFGSFGIRFHFFFHDLAF